MPLVFPVPPLSTTFSHILSLVFASIYVGSGVEVTVTVTSHVCAYGTATLLTLKFTEVQ